VIGDRQIGAIQVGTSLTVVDTTLQSLLIVLGLGLVIAMGIAGVASWISTRQALAPLEDVTSTALQITRADDLSRRIPFGTNNSLKLVNLSFFNPTLSRLENLFHYSTQILADVSLNYAHTLTVIKGNVELMRPFGYWDLNRLKSIESDCRTG
jgi:methyl-accepting chemotaxis protein